MNLIEKLHADLFYLTGQKHRLRAIRRGLKPGQAAASPSSSTLTSASESDDCNHTNAKKIGGGRRNVSASEAAKAEIKAAVAEPSKVEDKAKGHRHRSLTATNGRGGCNGGGGLELSRHFSSSCLAAARLYYSSHSRSTSSLRKAVSHSALNKSRDVDLSLSRTHHF